MKTITLKRRAINLDDYIRRTALESDYEKLIDEPTILIDEDEGAVKIIYDQLENFESRSIVEVLKKIQYHEGRRSRGLKSVSRIMGFRPRNELRADFCSATSMAGDFPSEHAIVANLATKLEEYYQKYDPKMYAKHKGETDTKVRPSYRIEGKSVFTSRIINKNNPLKYHFDKGNFTDVYSCMIVFKGGGVEGGYLLVPEYGVGFKLPNNSIFLFDGQGIAHGVTPIKFTTPQSYRFSIVYYSLKRMWQCLEIDEELARIRKKKTTRERTRMNEPLTEEEKKLKEKNIKMMRDRQGRQ